MGVLKVKLFRPFSAQDFINAFPATTKKVAVLDRTKDPGSLGEPLFQDVCAAFLTNEAKAKFATTPLIIGGRYGIGSKEFTPAMVKATFDKLRAEGVSEEAIQTIHATIGLDIKARTPAEISISILAEIIQEKNHRYLSFVSRELLNIKEKGVLCIITDKKGSAPRGAGSMMFVGEYGITDTIGGGAIEHAVIQEAMNLDHVMEKEYQLNSSESAQLGMICGGSNRVLFVPLEAL